MSTIFLESSEFITTWETTSSNESISFSTRAISDIGSGGEPTPPKSVPSEYNFVVDWGDGNIEEFSGTNPNPTHTYSSAGVYEVTIDANPNIERALPNVQMNSNKLQSVEQWGGVAWRSLYGMFEATEDVSHNADDTPDLSGVGSAREAFKDTTNFITAWPIDKWATGAIRSMESMFENSNYQGEQVSEWEVGNVQNMSKMFLNAFSFEADFSTWDVSSVTDMSFMFEILFWVEQRVKILNTD